MHTSVIALEVDQRLVHNTCPDGVRMMDVRPPRRLCMKTSCTSTGSGSLGRQKLTGLSERISECAAMTASTQHACTRRQHQIARLKFLIRCKCSGDGGASRVSLQRRVVGSDRVDRRLLGGKGLSVVSVFWRCVAFLLSITRRSVPATETPPDLAMSPRRNMATSQARTPNRTRRETQCMFATKAEVPHTTPTPRTNDEFRTAGCKRTSTQRAGSQKCGRRRLKAGGAPP